MMDLSGKTALISGAGSGLGAYFAQTLAEAGASLVLVGRRAERLEEVAAKLPAAAVPNAHPIALDITQTANLASAFTAAPAPIDILVNNAGINRGARALDMTEADYDAIMDVNLKAAYFLSQEMARRCIAEQRAGRIINIASIGAAKALPGGSVYGASKAGLVMLTKSLAREWLGKQINVNALAPGYIETELNRDWFASEGGKAQLRAFPRKRLAQKADLARALLLLADFATDGITGTTITIDDGQTL